MQAAAAGSPGEAPFVPDMARRQLMNNILLSSVGLSAGGLAYCYIDFFVPNTGSGGSGGTAAKDTLGNTVKLDAWKAAHPAGDYSLV